MTKSSETQKTMTVQETTNPKDEAQKIWDQLEAEESGNAQPPHEDEQNPPTDAQANAHPTDDAPASKADANAEGQAPSHEQILMDRISGLETMLGQVTQRLRNAEGHIGGLGSQLKQQQQVAAQVAARGGDAPTASEIRDAHHSPAKMEALKKDYPEFADAMESALNERLSGLEQQLKAQLQQPAQQPNGVSHEEIHRLRSEMAVEVRHPGWQDRVQTPEFTGWLNRQPREVQMLAASESPQDAIRLLDLHKDAVSSTTSQRTQRLASAAAIPTGRAAGSTRGKAVEDMTPEEYWRYLDQQDKQKGN